MPTTTFGLQFGILSGCGRLFGMEEFKILGETIKKCENTEIVSSSHIVKVSASLWPKGYTGD